MLDTTQEKVAITLLMDIYVLVSTNLQAQIHTGDFMKKVPTATCAFRDR